jgi:hypothetical protein
MGQGWIFAHRSMLECAELKGNPFALAVWVHVLLRASHRPARLSFRDQVVVVERGQMLTSLRQIEADTGVSLQRLRTILRKFASAKMLKINTVGNTAATLITVCKYEEYQKGADQANTGDGTLPTQHQHSTNTQNKKVRTKTPTVETQITVPPTGGTAAPPEAAKQALWREMKAQIGGNNPGSLVGKWVKLHGLPAVTDAHFAAMGNPPADYVEWMTKRLQANGKPYAARQPRGGKSYHDLVTESLTDDDESGSEAVHGMPGETSVLRPGRADDDAGGYGSTGPYLRAIAGGL